MKQFQNVMLFTLKVVPRKCIAEEGLRLYQYTAIDEYSRFRILGAYPEQRSYSSYLFLLKVITEFTKYHAVIFIHGCFWHRHENCKDATIPKTRTEFWVEKLQKNVLNDQKNKEILENCGWNVIVIWECEINKNFNELMNSVEQKILTGSVKK